MTDGNASRVAPLPKWAVDRLAFSACGVVSARRFTAVVSPARVRDGRGDFLCSRERKPPKRNAPDVLGRSAGIRYRSARLEPGRCKALVRRGRVVPFPRTTTQQMPGSRRALRGLASRPCSALRCLDVATGTPATSRLDHERLAKPEWHRIPADLPWSPCGRSPAFLAPAGPRRRASLPDGAVARVPARHPSGLSVFRCGTRRDIRKGRALVGFSSRTDAFAAFAASAGRYVSKSTAVATVVAVGRRSGFSREWVWCTSHRPVAARPNTVRLSRLKALLRVGFGAGDVRVVSEVPL